MAPTFIRGHNGELVRLDSIEVIINARGRVSAHTSGHSVDLHAGGTLEDAKLFADRLEELIRTEVGEIRTVGENPKPDAGQPLDPEDVHPVLREGLL